MIVRLRNLRALARARAGAMTGAQWHGGALIAAAAPGNTAAARRARRRRNAGNRGAALGNRGPCNPALARGRGGP